MIRFSIRGMEGVGLVGGCRQMQPYLVNVIGQPGLSVSSINKVLCYVKCLPSVTLRLTQPFKFLFIKDFHDFL